MANINGVGITTNDSWSYFGCNKTITLSDYGSLVDLIASNTNLSHIGPIFRNCNVTSCDTMPVMGIPYMSTNSRITSFNRTYSGFSAKDIGGNAIPVLLDEDFFEYLPSVTGCYYVFSQT